MLKRLILILTMFCASFSFAQNPLMMIWGDLEGSLRDLNNKWFNTSDNKTLFVLGGKGQLTQTFAQVQAILDGTMDFTIDLTGTATNQILLPSSNDATTPTIAFGDGDTGIYEYADDGMAFTFSESQKWILHSTQFASDNALGGFIRQLGVSATVPSIGVATGDSDVGLGRAGTDQLSLIAGGVEGMRISENTSISVVTQGSFNFALDTSTANQLNIYDLVIVEFGDYGGSGIVAGTQVSWIAGHQNSGASNILVNAFAQKDLLKMGDQELASGDIEAGQIVTAIYDGSAWQMTSQLAQ